MLPVAIDFAVIGRILAIVGIAAASWVVFDAIGDAREARVWARINAAIEKTNSDIDQQLDLDEKVALVAQKARDKAFDDAKRILKDNPACVASPEEAQALTDIK